MGLKLLQKMGWKQGDAIGDTMATIQPVIKIKPKDLSNGGIFRLIITYM